jgi:hypothetical protein
MAMVRRVITPVVVVLGVAVVVGMLPTAAEMAAEAPVAVAAVHDTRDRAAAPGAPFYAVRVAEDDSDSDTLPEVDAPARAENDAYGALIFAGARGAMNDRESAVYARVGRVFDYGAGTLTITTRGPAICVDGPDDRPCTGREFLTPEWQSY